MTTSAEQRRAWTGPAILTVGFRLFFLLAGIWATLAMSLWITILSGAMDLPTAFDPVSWHAHEFLWGYLAAVAAGFLLTAVPNWTGRLPVVGWPVAWLAAFWLLGRLAVGLSAWLPTVVTALADLSFLVALTCVLAREIIAGRNWRNLKVLVLLAVLALGNALFHLEAFHGDYAAGGVGLRIGLGAGVMMILVIGGRVTPSFTRNWLVKQGKSARPAAFGRLDQVALAIALAALFGWIIAPDTAWVAVLCLTAGATNLLRLARWSGGRTLAEPLVTILHVGYGLTALGFVTVGAATLGLGSATGAQHVWMAGGIGTMTLAMMTRASLGHAGLPLTATWPISAIYLAIIGATLARLGAGYSPFHDHLVQFAGAFWIAAFGGFTIVYWPILTRARTESKLPSRARTNP